MRDAATITRCNDGSKLSWLSGWWFALGCPAFGGLIVVFYLMAGRPSW